MQQNAIKEKTAVTIQIQLEELSELIKLSENTCLDRQEVFFEFKKINTIEDACTKTNKKTTYKKNFNPKLEYIFYIICLTHFNLISLSVLGAYFKVHRFLN